MTADSPDLDQLDALARAATEGPWIADVRSDGRAWIDLPGVDDHGLSLHGFAADAEFIAATDPTTVLALTAELRSLRRWKADAMHVIDGLQEVGHALDIGLGERITGRGAVDAAMDLKAELRQARADRDAALGKVAAVQQLADDDTRHVRRWVDDSHLVDVSDLRAALDSPDRVSR